MECLNIIVTVPNQKTVNKIKKELLTQKIVSCITIIDKIDSFYWWERKIVNSKEKLLLMKTVRSKFALLEKIVKANHPYKVPEIIAFKIDIANKDYLKWVSQTVNASGVK